MVFGVRCLAFNVCCLLCAWLVVRCSLHIAIILWFVACCSMFAVRYVLLVGGCSSLVGWCSLCVACLFVVVG